MNREECQPIATYRLQFNADFRFADAQSLVPYFSRLGVTHAYASPVLRCRQDSTHGYDVVDPATINPNLGDKTDLCAFVNALHNFGLSLLVDIVPNHMAASIENPYWRDVLTYGPSSPFAGWFDIDWRMPDRDMWGRVLVPVLGEARRRVLENDQIRLEWSDGRFLVRYFNHTFPVDPATVPNICRFGMQSLPQLLDDHPALEQINQILRRLEKLPKLVARLRRQVEIDREETEQWLGQFAQLVVQSPRIQNWVEETADRFSEEVEGQVRLRKLLDAQPYRLVHWREAARTINYRRFFDINELISVRQEDPHVFDETHATLFRWIEEGLVGGLRVDHIDGLRDPLGYLERLAESVSSLERQERAVPIFVEKILAFDEKLPCGWPVEGTTGYDFLNQVEAIFVSPAGFDEIEVGYRRMLRRPVSFEQIAAWGKRRVLRNDLSPHVGRLADILLRLAESSNYSPTTAADGEVVSTHAAAGLHSANRGESSDVSSTRSISAILPIDRHGLTKRELVDAVVEVVVALPVYRTYIDSTHCTVSDADRQYVETALTAARQSGRAAPEALEFLGQVLLLDNKSQLPEHELYERVNFIQRFQQLTGPAAAKGIEDTALYVYVPLVSLNEVGGEPRLHDGNTTAVLHRSNDDRAATRPRAMLSVTTHDTKRTADVRSRLDVLSELPTLWNGLVRRWQRLNAPLRTRVRGKHVPDATTEYLFYQTVLGIWPVPDPRQPHELPDSATLGDLRRRIDEYMIKAVREAKLQTSWTNCNREFEEGLVRFIGKLLSDGETGENSFLPDVQNMVARIARHGFWNSLSRTLVQFTAPGTPDLYQGDELWNFALVDPDNRRPVDFAHRARLLDEVVTGIESADDERRGFLQQLVETPEDGRIKLHVIRSALAARRELPFLFASGKYLPLGVSGPHAEHVFAFARTASDQAAIAVVPRLTASIVKKPDQPPIGPDVWMETTVHLPEALQNRAWTSALTREQIASATHGRLAVADILDTLPVGLLLCE